MIAALLLAAVLDTVKMTLPVHTALQATPADSLSGWCATQWFRDAEHETVYLTTIRRAEDSNPTCAAGQAVVLVRPACLFGMSEFASLPYRVPEVVIICRPHAQGIPLSPMRRTERAG